MLTYPAAGVAKLSAGILGSAVPKAYMLGSTYLGDLQEDRNAPAIALSGKCVTMNHAP